MNIEKSEISKFNVKIDKKGNIYTDNLPCWVYLNDENEAFNLVAQPLRIIDDKIYRFYVVRRLSDFTELLLTKEEFDSFRQMRPSMFYKKRKK